MMATRRSTRNRIRPYFLGAKAMDGEVRRIRNLQLLSEIYGCPFRVTEDVVAYYVGRIPPREAP